MADAVKRATYEDVLRAPAHMVAEVIDGVLSTHQRPASPHTQAATTLGEELGPPFKRGKGGPGGWVILDETELRLGAEPDILVPDRRAGDARRCPRCSSSGLSLRLQRYALPVQPRPRRVPWRGTRVGWTFCRSK